MAGSEHGSLWRGLTLPARAARLLWRLPDVKSLAMLPVLMTFLVYFAVIAVAFWGLWNWDWSVGQESWQFWGGFGAWLHGALNRSMDVVKWVVALPVMLVFCYFTFTAAGMILASPLNDMLSEKIERAICHPQNRPHLTWNQQVRIVIVSILDSLAILARQLGWIVVVLPFLLIPYVGFLPLFLVTAYHTGLGFVDVAMARNSLRRGHKRLLTHPHRRTLLGMGLAMEMMFLVPFLGLFLLPVGVVAGTLLYCGFDWETAFRSQQLAPPRNFVPPRLRAPSD